MRRNVRTFFLLSFLLFNCVNAGLIQRIKNRIYRRKKEQISFILKTAMAGAVVGGLATWLILYFLKSDLCSEPIRIHLGEGLKNFAEKCK